SWLSGCVNDANDASKALKKFGFTARNIQVLRDKDATKKKVITALTTIVDKAKAGDHVVFTFSSHGTQVPSEDDDEPDGLDEAFACHDLKQRGDDWDRKTVIVDNELHDLFAKVPEGVLVEVLLDTCHSGSGLKDLDDIQQAMLMGRRPRFLPPPTPKGLGRVRSIREARPRGVDNKLLVELTKMPRGSAKPVLYAACKSNQTASDATFSDRPNGAFTFLFLKSLAEDPKRTRSQLQSAVISGLKSGDFEQRSTLEGPPKAKKVGFGQPF
ncbi:MAG: peptidase caspase catalytic subunit p20, partial [Frankiales bacterium]|nr:peptidase caspase catalytic subunit p20 [Frankiales bacterium]